MKTEIEFGKKEVTNIFLNISTSFRLSEIFFEKGNIVENIWNTGDFELCMRCLKIYGADTETGTYNDGKFYRIGFARINSHTFIKNGKFSTRELMTALKEIADGKWNDKTEPEEK